MPFGARILLNSRSKISMDGFKCYFYYERNRSDRVPGPQHVARSAVALRRTLDLYANAGLIFLLPVVHIIAHLRHSESKYSTCWQSNLKSRHHYPSMFQPRHGRAPHIAGKSIVARLSRSHQPFNPPYSISLCFPLKTPPTEPICLLSEGKEAPVPWMY